MRFQLNNWPALASHTGAAILGFIIFNMNDRPRKPPIATTGLYFVDTASKGPVGKSYLLANGCLISEAKTTNWGQLRFHHVKPRALNRLRPFKTPKLRLHSKKRSFKSCGEKPRVSYAQ